MLKINQTDLHIKYTMETGDNFQFNPGFRDNHGGTSYHSTDSYSREYCKWVEEKYLEELQKKHDVEEFTEIILDLEEANRELSDELDELNEEIDFWVDRHNDIKE